MTVTENEKKSEESLMQIRGLKQHFSINPHLLIKAVDGIDFDIRKGEVFGLVGETGCGKSTVAKTLSGIYHPTEGTIQYKDFIRSSDRMAHSVLMEYQRDMQMIFQDSAASLNPRMTVEKIILEPMKIRKLNSNTDEKREKLLTMMQNVGLSDTFLTKHPGELSGGQRQRVAIARSLMLDPELIIADEPIASLDISIQAQIMSLFQRLQRERRFSLLFIAHDLSAVRYISDRIGVMFRGKIVELAPTEELFANPKHPYTQSLLSAVHIPDPIAERRKKILYYDPNMELGESFEEIEKGHWLLV